MLMPMTPLLWEAKSKHQLIPAFNVYSLETVQAAIQASNDVQRPLILAFGERYLNNASFRSIAAIVNSCLELSTQDISLHLDHCKSLINVQKALDAGFTSVMFDGSMETFAENVSKTSKAKQLAVSYHASIEGELGGMNDETGGEGPSCLTDPRAAALFADETGIDCLAVSIGNKHGLYKGQPHIDMVRLQQIAQATSVPLVLHGCSGIDEDTISQAVAFGITKINVNTEIAMAAASSVRNTQCSRLEDVLIEMRGCMTDVMKKYYI